MKSLETSLPLAALLLVLLFSSPPVSSNVYGMPVSLPSSKDNTLYEFDPDDLNSPLNSNGSGNLFSAGRNRSRSLIRRGLIYFDLSSLPAGAVVVPGSVELDLHVVDAPNNDNSGEPRAFWLVPLDQDWGEGASTANAGVSGAGSGAAAADGDATWLHTLYDSTIHDPRNPNPTDPGYWPLEGALGNLPLDPSVFGGPAGIVPAAPFVGPVTLASAAMEADINAWLANPSSNFGWIVLGDERVAAANVSSNRGFASRENPTLGPILTFEYSIENPVVPEPDSLLISVFGLAILCWCCRHRMGRLQRTG